MPGTTRDAVRRVALALAGVVIGLTAFSGCQQETTARITASVGLFGGPALPGGGMALNGAPAIGVDVTVEAADGATWTAITDARGEATLVVSPGSYEVSSTGCGPTRVVAHAGTTTPVSIKCSVP